MQMNQLFFYVLNNTTGDNKEAKSVIVKTNEIISVNLQFRLTDIISQISPKRQDLENNVTNKRCRE
jgi:hypothetical protein